MRRFIQLFLGTAAVVLAGTAGSAKANLLPGLIGGNCGATTAAFKAWNDGAGYYLAPNGGFESGSTGWSLSGGSAVVSGNEPFFLAGPGSHSLLMPTGGRASISVCYGLTYPGLRFLVAATGGKQAKVHVRVVAHSLLGALSVLDGGTFTTGTGWAPSPKISTLFSALAAPVGTKSLELQISVESGAAQIDDLFVDPFLTKS